MSEEKNNSNFDINTKYEDMINISQRIIEHHEFVSDGSCEPPNYICLAYDVKNYLPDLLRENEELKKQLKIKHDGFMESVEESCELAEENQKYKEVIDKAVEKIESWYFALDYAERDRLKIIVEILKEVE